MRDLAGLGRADAWDGIKVVVAGFGVAGIAAVDNLLFLGADVAAVDEAENAHGERAELLESLGATLHLGAGSSATDLPDGVDLVIASPGWEPGQPLLAAAAERGIPIWSEIELAWRLRHPDHSTPWLAVSGARGKSTTARMVDSILRAAGLRSAAVGDGGLSVVEAVMEPTPYDVLVVEVAASQLHWTASVRAESAVVLNAGSEVDPAVTGGVYHQVERVCVYNVEDPLTEEMVREADVVEGARAIGVTLGMPSIGMLGLVEDMLVDRAFITERATSAAELLTIADLGSDDPHMVADALAAAALARAHGISRSAVRDGLTQPRTEA